VSRCGSSFKWRADEEESPDPMARLRAPKVIVTAVPVFTSVELSELEKACQGRSFAARRDAAIIAVFTATGIRLSELAGIRYHAGDPARSDLDLQQAFAHRQGFEEEDKVAGEPQAVAAHEFEEFTECVSDLQLAE
jgi:site-specific recombinase XerD